MTDSRDTRIAALRTDIAQLTAALVGFERMPALQAQIRAELAAKQAELDALLGASAAGGRVQTGGVDMGSAQISEMGDVVGGDKVTGADRQPSQPSAPAPQPPSPVDPAPFPPGSSVQTGGVNMGNARIGKMGDVIGGNKIEYRAPAAPPLSGTAATLRRQSLRRQIDALQEEFAATDAALASALDPTTVIRLQRKLDQQTQAIAAAEAHLAELSPTPAPAAPPALRLWLADPSGQPIAALAAGQSARLCAGVLGDAARLPALTLRLVADAESVVWTEGAERELLLTPGAEPRPAVWPLVAQRVSALTIRVTALAGGTFVQQATLSANVQASSAAPTLTSTAGAGAAPPPTVPVGLTLSAAPAVAARGDALTLILDAEREGFRARLIDGGSATTATLAITPDQIVDALAYSRSELLAIVHHTEGGAYVFGGSDLTIPQPRAEWALANLARAGATLWQQLFAGPGGSDDARRLGERLRERSRSGALRLTVVGSHLPFPWPLLYDGDPTREVTADGFWGFRHVLATLPTSGRVGPRAGETSFGPAAGMAAIVGYNRTVDYFPVNQPPPGVIAPQVAALAALGIAPAEVTTEAALRDAIASGSDARLVYLYCHVRSAGLGTAAQRPGRPGGLPGIGSTRIELTEAKAALALRDLQLAAPLDGTPRLRGGPLVVLNACGSAELSPLTYDGLAPYLLDLGARALVGTECETPITFGAAFGPALLTALLRDAKPLGEALRDTRRAFWEQHRNPLGLLYALYGNPELRVDTGD